MRKQPRIVERLLKTARTNAQNLNLRECTLFPVLARAAAEPIAQAKAVLAQYGISRGQQ